jgi:polysaccharide biosynthesis/export protein
MTARAVHDDCGAPALRGCAGLLLLLLLTGCAVVPGLRVDERRLAAFTPTGESGASYRVEIRSIDADLLRQMRLDRAVSDGSRERRSRQDLKSGYQYVVGAGDVLNVLVWGHPELNNPLGQFQDIEAIGRLVREDGTIFFPYVGLLPVAGMTTEEIRRHVSAELRPYVQDPQVDVRVVAYRSQKVYVTGALREPGVLPITAQPMTALDAISMAGGFTDAADRRRMVLTRDGTEHPLDLLDLYATGNGDLVLRDGDVLHIPDNTFNKVFLVGEVARQMSVPLHEGRLTLAEAISEANGLSLGTANTEQIYVLRAQPVQDADGAVRGIRPQVFHLNARSAVALVLAESFELEPRDIVFVSSTPAVRFNRVIQQILPTVQTLWQTDRIIRG